MIWVTRERPRVDRIACPWLIRRFIDPDAEFRFVPAHRVLETAAVLGGKAFDTQGAVYSHRKSAAGERCSFETLIDEFSLSGDPALAELARIVHAADIHSNVDTHQFGAALRAIGDAGGTVESDDHRLLDRALFVYDALYVHCQVLTTRTIVFVCEHGAGRSRVAAALFAVGRLPGWKATTAGLTPQETVSVHAARLLTGEEAGELIDLGPPVDLPAEQPDLVIAIDCDVPNGRRWSLAGEWPSEQVRDELRTRVARLIGELGHRSA